MAMNKLRVLISDTHDPWFNLATEEWIFRDMDLSTHTLFLWRNKPTVVIGRSQNPWAECHLKNMERDRVLLARRQSGGGAVFQDLGNTNFTFLSSLKDYNKTANAEIIKSALTSFDINTSSQGRNDIVVGSKDPRKISGSAFRQTSDRAFHHGTLLINVDLTRMQLYLNPNKKKLQAKGIRSVRSRVANLIEYNPELKHEVLCPELINAFFNYHDNDCEIEVLNHDQLQNMPQLNDYYQQLKDWNWRFGRTLEFTHQFEERFNGGIVDVRLNVKNGIIDQAEIYSDSLFPDFIDQITQSLNGCRYMAEDVDKSLQNIDEQSDEIKPFQAEIHQWLVDCI